MNEMQSDSVHLENLLLRNYGVFLGSNELKLDRYRTLIVGSNGTGKITIVNTLSPGATNRNGTTLPHLMLIAFGPCRCPHGFGEKGTGRVIALTRKRSRPFLATSSKKC